MKNYISVLIATYNRCHDLKNTLASLLCQEEDGTFDFEIIVVDNNSSDATMEVVQTFAKQSNGRIKSLFEAKQGKSFALNRGLAEAHGNIVACTDDDCKAAEDWLKNINRYFKEHNLDMLCGKIIPTFNVPKPYWLDLTVKIFHGPYVYFDLGEQFLDNSVRPIFPAGANMILKRISLEKYGGYNTPRRAEDTELGYKWHEQGARIAYAPDVLVYHVTPASRLTKNYVRKWQFLCGKNSTLIFQRNYNGERKFLGTPLWVYKNTLKSIFRYVKSLLVFPKNSFAKELWVWFHLGTIWSYWAKETPFEDLR